MEPLKNIFSPKLVVCIAQNLEKHLESFDRVAFESSILKALPALELKARAQLIADQLHLVLPSDQKLRNKILHAMLHPIEDIQSDQQSDEQGICGWGIFPLTLVVGQHGLDEYEDSLMLLKEMTKRFTSEFAVRYHLLADQARALQIMSTWLSDPNHHVRRLVSEGTRPRLPWAMQLTQLIADPSPALPLLKTLRDDKEEYVRRSVANHLNDISKDHPDLVAELAKDWMQGADKIREKLVRHACRTLIKQGHTVALAAFGFGPAKVELKQFGIETDIVALGNSLRFNVDLHSTSSTSQSLVIDYVLHFKKANGKRVGKVFKWKNISLKARETFALQRSHAIRLITTRRYYAGQQALSLRINGQDFGFETFDLTVPNNKPATVE